MVQTVRAQNAACRLDYLVGTIATAYKGNIGSLVAKDFCMTDDGNETSFQGTILAMPQGEYEAVLNQSGAELSRSVLRSGVFSFSADSRRIAATRDLQIDIVRSGRHVGTFLLKKENNGGLYLSAVELSEDLAGMDLTRLTSPVKDKPGLLWKAEDIVSRILSTKKDWAAFSEDLAVFARDLSWSEPAGFERAFGVLVRFMLLAAERTAGADRSKPVSNYIDLLDLLGLDKGAYATLQPLALVWVQALSRSSLDLAPQARRSATSLRRLLDRFPGLGIREAALVLIRSIQGRIASVPFLDSRALEPLAGLIPGEDVMLLSRFGEAGRRRMERELDEAERLLKGDDLARALAVLVGLDFDVLDDRKAVELLFDIAEKDLTPASAGPVLQVIAAYLASAARLSGAMLESIGFSLPRIMDRMLGLGLAGECIILVRGISESGSGAMERILLNGRIARLVLQSGQDPLIAAYADAVKRITIPAARVQGLSPDSWAEIVDPRHLDLLMKFMDLLGSGTGALEGVLIHVIANLSVGGVLIPDDRLFQRQVSAFLNSPAMEGPFLLNELLLARLPVYFNDVGAVSKVRDYSTEIDSRGNDPVIYFVRKQVHVNASSQNVRLIEAVLRSWAKNDPTLLQTIVPPDIYAQTRPGLIAGYSPVIRGFFRDSGVEDEGGLHLEKLLELTDETIDRLLPEGDDRDGEARRKVKLLSKLYKEVSRKYALLVRDTAVVDVNAGLQAAVEALQEYKGIILSPERTEAQESLYFKRHIAFGIPSVLGTYHEPKFDALCGLMRRGEEVPVLLEAILSRMEEKGATANSGDLRQWLAALAAAWQALRQYGMRNIRIDEFSVVLEQDRLHPTQTIDLLKLWQKELAGMVSSLSRMFHGPLMDVIERLPRNDLPEHLLVLDVSSPDFAGKAADVVMRDILSSIPGLVESDRLLASLISIFRTLPDGIFVSRYSDGTLPREPGFYDIHALGIADAWRLGPVLGAKAKNLVLLKEKGLPVPAGVVLPAGQTRSGPPGREQGPDDQVLREGVRAIEAQTGRVFGGIDRPLFLSVRSGSYLSMPGILSSILYCGMNERTAHAFINETGDPALGWDSYRRFIEHYGTAVLGLDIEFFEQAAGGPGRGSGADVHPDAEHARSLVSRYQERLRSLGLQVPDDVYEQLRCCVHAVYASWQSDRARQFRAATGTSEEWGTSVTLMEMIPGNQEGSGASVFFTRDPSTHEEAIFGEVRENASGDDLASGRKSGVPLSRRQAAAGQKNLEDLDPGLFRLHQELARTIEAAFDGLPQEVEVTYTRGRDKAPMLYVLQSRSMEEGDGADAAFPAGCGMESRVIGRGIGVNGGALSGVASFAPSVDQAARLAHESGLPVILIRRTADTKDVSLMPVIRGIITAAGGVTSHASVLALKFGLTAVVSCADLTVDVDEAGRPFAMIGTTRIREGSPLSLDGKKGLVFSGTCRPAKERS